MFTFTFTLPQVLVFVLGPQVLVLSLSSNLKSLITNTAIIIDRENALRLNSSANCLTELREPRSSNMTITSSFPVLFVMLARAASARSALRHARITRAPTNHTGWSTVSTQMNGIDGMNGNRAWVCTYQVLMSSYWSAMLDIEISNIADQ